MTVIAKKLTTVTVGDTEYTLVPTLTAVRSITHVCGGLRHVGEKIMSLDFDVIATVIIAGAALTLKPREYDELVTAIWQSEDRGDILLKCVDFWRVLNNGGRDPDESDAEVEETEGNA